MQFMILSRGLVAVVGCLAFAGAASDVLAQQNSMFGSGGATGGSGGVSSAAIGSTAFPSSKFPAGGAATGTTGMGAGMGAQQGMGAMGAGGQQTGLVGQRTGTLIGINQIGQTATGQNGQVNNRQGQNRNNANRRTGQNGNQTNQAGGAAGNQQQRTVRPQMVVAFDHPRPTAETIQANLETRFDKLASKTEFKGITIEADGSRVILRGEVDSARSGKLAAILARMEPGVSKVQNELTVKEPTFPSPSAVE